MSDEIQPGLINIQSQWMINPGEIPATVNQILLQGGLNVGISEGVPGPADGIYLSFGHMSPPLAQPQPGEIIPIIPIGRYHLSKERLAEFHQVSGGFLNGFEIES